MSLTLIGHGYIGQAIAAELIDQSMDFRWDSHEGWGLPTGNAPMIINAAGFTGNPTVDDCEVKRDACASGNIVWPVHVERHAGMIPVLHIGSGCIYEGSKRFGRGWQESDVPNFCGSYYSVCKAMAEFSIAPWLSVKSWVLRVRMPFGPLSHPRNLLTKLRTYEKLWDSTNSLSCIEDVAKTVAWFAKNRPPAGIYNCTNPGKATTKEVAKLVGRDGPWLSDLEFAAITVAARSACILDNSKLQEICPLPDLMERLAECAGQERLFSGMTPSERTLLQSKEMGHA